MANSIGVNVNYIMALSAYESGWDGPHAQDLNNLFGLTNAGGNDLTFGSYQASANYWVQHYGSTVAGASSIGAFVNDLLAIGYNQNINGDYYTTIVGGTLSNGKHTIGVYQSVLNAEKNCGITVN